MGLADREYQRESPRQHHHGPLAHAPVTKLLLGTCVFIYFADVLWFKGVVRDFGCFAVHSAFGELRLWEFVTFQFLHGSVGHLLFNCIGLWFFGPIVERWWGSGRFLAFYLLCGAAGALFFTLLGALGWIPHAGAPLVGASAGIYGVLIATAVIAPDARVHLLFPPVEMSMRTFALCLMGLAVVMIASNWNDNAGGEAGHLGGAVLGFVLARWPFLLGKQGRAAVRPPFGSHRPAPRPANSEDAAEIDRILDKISHHGLHSLTAQERERLRAMSGKPNDSSP